MFSFKRDLRKKVEIEIYTDTVCTILYEKYIKYAKFVWIFIHVASISATISKSDEISIYFNLRERFAYV